MNAAAEWAMWGLVVLCWAGALLILALAADVAQTAYRRWKYN